MSIATADPDLVRRLGTALSGALAQATASANAAAHLSGDLTPVIGLDPVARWGEAWAASLAERADLLEAMAPVSGMLVDAAGLLALVEAADHALTTPAAISWEDLDRAVDASGAALDWLVQHSPATVAAGFVQSLDPMVADALARRRPAIGNLPGVPLEVTFAANRRRIELAIDETDRRIDGAGPGTALGLVAEREVLMGMLRRDLVVFDWEGDGRLAEWVGPHDASNVVVLVPGMGTDKVDADLMRANAERILRIVGDGDTAVVTALVYDPPDGADVALPGAADAGVDGLVDLVGRLPLEDRHLVLMSHSYGSLVLGRALAGGLAAELPDDHDLIVFGSPGLGVDHAGDLGLEPDRVWAAGASLDHVVLGVDVLGRAWSSLLSAGVGALASAVPGSPPPAALPSLGALPTDPRFGARILDGGDGGHSAYLASQIVSGHDRRFFRAVEVPSAALAAFAAVITGSVRRPVSKRTTPPSRAGKTGPGG